MLKQTRNSFLATVALVLVLALLVGGCAPAEPEPVEDPGPVEDPEPIEDPEPYPGTVEVPDLEPHLAGTLGPVHPDEPADHTYNQRFSLENSLQRLDQIEDFGLSALVQLELHGETSMAFFNWVGSVGGTLMKQDYEIKRLELELARLQYMEGRIGEAEMEIKKSAYERSRENFKTFWDAFGIAD